MADDSLVDNTSDLRVLLTTPHPLVVVEARDEKRFLDMLRETAGELERPVWVWTAAKGLSRDGHAAMYLTNDPRMALAFVSDIEEPGVYVFADAHHPLTDPVILRGVKDVALGMGEGQTLILSGPHGEVPAELEGVAVRWQQRHPDTQELMGLIERTLTDLVERGMTDDLPPAARSDLADALRGVSLADAERLLQRAILRDGSLGAEDVPYLRAAKAELLNTDGVVELIESHTSTIDDIGGLHGLKEWLRVRGSTLGSDEAAAMGIDAPRGILLTGIPGCGKSLVAKTVATTWSRPLILLDPGRLYGKYVGESEERLRGALDTVDAMAPAVLWIDEIEKGFASPGNGDGGVSARLLGTFLRWLQERPEGVFVVATANDVTSLPPEFLRRGRFDEVFFVDLPQNAARRAIFGGQLAQRGHRPDQFDLDALVEATDGFSGAEIEAVVVGALYRAFAGNTELGTQELLSEAAATIPLSVSRSEDVARLRTWAEDRAVTAG